MPAEPCPPNGARQTCARSIAICTDTYYLLAATPSSGNQIKLVQGGGFEPPKLARQIYSLIPLATREPLRKRPNIFYTLRIHVKGTPDTENGAGERSRTPDRLITSQLLYQLSYASMLIALFWSGDSIGSA